MDLPKPRVPKRYVVAGLVYLGILCQYSMRRNLDVAIVGMVNTTSEEQLETSGADPPAKPEFDWSQAMIGVLFGCFYWGYILTKLVGGYLSYRFSATRVLLSSIFLGAIIHIIQPPAARLSVGTLIFTIILQGCAEGMTMPSAFSVLGAWAHHAEKSRLSSMVLAGQYIGMAIGTAATGAITDKLGWAGSFYIFGLFGVTWGIIADLFIREMSLEVAPENPEDDSFLGDDNDSHSVSAKPTPPPKVRPPVPWKHLLTSLPVYSIVLCQVCLKCATHLMLIYAPLYYVHTFHINASLTGIIVALPPLVSGLFMPLSGMLADSRYGRQTRSTTVVRKTLNTVGFFGLAACYILLAVSTNLGMSLASFCVAGFFVALCMGGGFNVNPLDLSPSFAGLIKGISTSSSHLAGSIWVVIVGVLTKHKTNHEWSIVFTVVACILVAAGIVYLAFGSGEEQPWSRGAPDKKTLTFASQQGPPDMKHGFTRAMLTVQGHVEEDYTVHDDFTRSSDEEELPLSEEDGKLDRFDGR
ncbi:vesicular glutamate transporter 1-like isoform X1 [Branchiostoma lanceolatum]|uniref:vesicular glutamate transporter 1-like isoform X1 n=1 Tax=Branchiostoma lanceolatum TaxID=7740 RepID=UPI003455B7F7